jgi:U4/U6 small nuclear ribonucleoprotein PRP31
MASLADELLNDFDDSGSENNEDTDGFAANGDTNGPNGNGLDNQHQDMSHEQDSDDDADQNMEDAEEEVAAAKDAARVDTVDDEDDTKARVEKMRLGGVRDVRSVAGLMKVLQPVLEVSFPSILSQASRWFTYWQTQS